MNNPANNSLAQLKDIKSIVAVPDSSFYIFVAIVVTLLALLGYLLYRYFTRVKRTKRATPKELALKRLKEIDFNNTKELAYRLSVDGYLFVNENNVDEFSAIESALEPYKYKKETQKLPQELIERVKKFIKGVKNV